MEAEIGASKEDFDSVAFSSNGSGVKWHVHIFDEMKGEFEGIDVGLNLIAALSMCCQHPSFR